MFGRVRFCWALAIPVVVIAVAVAVVARSDGGAEAPLVSLHLADGHLPQPFTMGPGAYHVDAQYSGGCQGGTYVIYADPRTVPPHTTAPQILPFSIDGTRWQNDFTIAGPRRFLIAQSSEADAFGQQGCIADVRITRTGNASGPPETPPVSVHCALEAVPCAIPSTLAPGQYTIRFSTKCGDWWLDGVDARTEHLSGLAQTTASYDAPTSGWLDDFSVPLAGRYRITHYVSADDPSNGLCTLDAQVFRLSALPSAGPHGECAVSAFADTKPDPDGHSLDVLATAVPASSGSGFCMFHQTSVGVYLVDAQGTPVATQGSPATFDVRSPEGGYAGPSGGFSPAQESSIGPLVWSNWCGGPVHAVVDVSVDGVAAHTTLAIPTPPACTVPGQTTTLRRVLVLH